MEEVVPYAPNDGFELYLPADELKLLLLPPATPELLPIIIGLLI